MFVLYGMITTKCLMFTKVNAVQRVVCSKKPCKIAELARFGEPCYSRIRAARTTLTGRVEGLL